MTDLDKVVIDLTTKGSIRELDGTWRLARTAFFPSQPTTDFVRRYGISLSELLRGLLESSFPTLGVTGATRSRPGLKYPRVYVKTQTETETLEAARHFLTDYGFIVREATFSGWDGKTPSPELSVRV